MDSECGKLEGKVSAQDVVVGDGDCPLLSCGQHLSVDGVGFGNCSPYMCIHPALNDLFHRAQAHVFCEGDDVWTAMLNQVGVHCSL